MKEAGYSDIVEMVDAKGDRNAFFCWDLIQFMKEENVTGDEWFEIFNQAKYNHHCKYESQCERHAKTINKPGRQLRLF